MLAKKTRVQIIIVILILGCGGWYGCTRPGYRGIENPHAQVPPTAQREKQAVAGNFSSQRVLTFDSVDLQQFITRYPRFADYHDDLHKFYIKRNFTYAWYDQKGMIEQAGSLFNRIENIHQEGITAQLPYVDNFTAMMEDH